MSEDVLWTVTYDGGPVCIVRTDDRLQAVSVAVGLVRLALTGSDDDGLLEDLRADSLPPVDAGRFALRTPTAAERRLFEASDTLTGDVRLGAVPLLGSVHDGPAGQ